MKVENLNIKLFADGADLKNIIELNNKSYIQGFTTNPTLMRQSGVSSYKSFASEIIKNIGNKSISFEVLSDDFREMERQGKEIASWGENVYVKIPISNCAGEATTNVIKNLVKQGCKLNITAIMTIEQVNNITQYLDSNIPSYVSIFGGRIADTGRDPVETFEEASEVIKKLTKCEMIWASPRELLNIFQAEKTGCHIITLTNDLLKKLPLIGKDLSEYSQDTVKMFVEDAVKSNLKL
jgi:transaldolase